jgi:general secretion pathway protein D
MAQNDLNAATALLAQADALNVQYSTLWLGDTPARARRDLDRARGDAAGGSSIFSPFSTRKQTPTDPFQGHAPAGTNPAPQGPSQGAAAQQQQSYGPQPYGPQPYGQQQYNAAGANTQQPSPQQYAQAPNGQAPNPQPVAGPMPFSADWATRPPQSNGTMTGRPDPTTIGASPFGSTSIAPPQQSDNRLPPALAERYANSGSVYGPPPSMGSAPAPTGDRARSVQMLRQARLSLAVGDVRRANDMVAQARREQIAFAPNEDNPDRVAAAIARYQEVMALDRDVEDNRRAYARMLMEQAESLLQYGELPQADELAAQAAKQRVAYGQYEMKPDDLLKRIASLRQQGAPAALPNGTTSGTMGGTYGTQGGVGPSMAARQRAGELMRAARATLSGGQLDQAEALARQADSMHIPDAAFGPGEDRPSAILRDIAQARIRYPSGVMPAAGTTDNGPGAFAAVYNSSIDPTSNVQASAQTNTTPERLPTVGGASADGNQSPGYALFQQGEAALKNHDRDRALQFYQQAASYMSQLDPVTAQRLQDKLQLLSASGTARGPNQAPAADDMNAVRQAQMRQLRMEVAQRESDARKMEEKDPKGALTMREETRKRVEMANLQPAERDRMLRQLDRAIAENKQNIEQNKPRLDAQEKLNRTRDEIDQERKNQDQVEKKLAELVDKYNHLIDEQRFEEAEVIAKEASQLAPKSPVTTVMLTKIKIQRSLAEELAIRDSKADGFDKEMNDVGRASIPFGKDNIAFPEAKDWRQLSMRRAKNAAERGRLHRTEREMEIEKKLRMPVLYSCRGKPLQMVLDQLAKYADVNINVDAEGLREEGLTPDTPVTLELSHEIMLKSYLDLVLEQHHLCYIIKHEVLNITSESKRSGQVFTVTYPVGDLVMPIPNFLPSQNMGLPGMIRDAMQGATNAGGGGGGAMQTPMNVVAATRDGKPASVGISPQIAANFAARTPASGQAGSGGGPGGAGNGTAPDFESLMDLITNTVAPKTWNQNGGPGSVAPFETNLSLVVSQTQEVHEQIADLLEQLRRLQDLQVTIEVRFITLSDSFFERIGVDFDFNIQSNVGNTQIAGFSAPITQNVGGTPVTAPVLATQSTGTNIVGLQGVGSNPAQSGIFTNSLDIPFQQGTYALAVPQFGGFDAAAGATVGFAVLSDIEAFFFINAAQGDKRTNVLQAPKVTLFNGQQAFVSDTSQTPFVISVIPVVGDFAAAQQPVIVVLSEGTFMTVQAVVSNDRRFVRLTIVPYFSKIGNVNTFTFSGSSSTTTNTTRQGLVNQVSGQFNNNTDQSTTTNTGVTVQLPTFSFTTVTTTVSVPDGGTVLLGGIKRLSEERGEYGTPILDKIPYIDRLFKNTAIGRDTSSLMMMVTPRIIIQEEEEEKLGVATGP